MFLNQIEEFVFVILGNVTYLDLANIYSVVGFLVFPNCSYL